jgi:Tol biopolymer transport system component
MIRNAGTAIRNNCVAAVLTTCSAWGVLSWRASTGYTASANSGTTWLLAEPQLRWHPGDHYLMDRPGVLGADAGAQRLFPFPYRRAEERFGGGYDWAPDGHSMVVGRVPLSPQAAQEIWIYDWTPRRASTHGRLIVGARFAQRNFAPVWEPAGRRIAFLRQSPPNKPADRARIDLQLCLTDADGAPPRVAVPLNVAKQTPLWSPRGKKVLVLVYNQTGLPNRRLVAVDGETLSQQDIVLPGASEPSISDLSWSPDADKIAYIAVDGAGRSSLSILDLRQKRVSTPSQEQEPTREGAVSLQAVRWSPNGRYISYTRRSVDPQGRLHSDLLMVELASGRARTLYSGIDLGGLAWSPDSSRMAVWDTLVNEHRRLVVANVLGTTTSRVSVLVRE